MAGIIVGSGHAKICACFPVPHTHRVSIYPRLTVNRLALERVLGFFGLDISREHKVLNTPARRPVLDKSF